MRVLLSSFPAVGHVLPLLPLGAALARRGHEVAVLSGPSTAALLPPRMPLLAAGPDLPEMFAAIPPRSPADPPLDPIAPASLAKFFGLMRAAMTLDRAREHLDAWPPDLVVSEGLDSVGRVLAAERELPHRTVSLGPVCSQEAATAMVDELEGIGLHTAETRWLDPWPTALRPPGWASPVPWQQIGPVPGHAGVAEAPGDLVPDGDGPAVLLSFGTLHDEPAAVAAVASALVARGLRVVCALGPRHGVEVLDGMRDVDPRRVRVHAFPPLSPILERVDGVVCHGGAGTVLTALHFGRPLLVVPQGADHHLVAAGVEGAGAGWVRRSDAPPAELADAAAAVVTDEAVRTGAGRVAGAMASAPGPDEVAAELEDLVLASAG